MGENECLPKTGEFFDGGWTMVKTYESSVAQFEIDPMTAVTIDCGSRVGD